jgi:sulfoxide reductase catalytic subunit YedY
MRMAYDDDQVTPRPLYMNRRMLMRGGLLAATAAGTGWLYRKLNDPSSGGAHTAKLDGLVAAPSGSASGFVVTGEAQTAFESATHYNNFYEFSTDKEDVAQAAAGFVTTGWKLAVGGLVKDPHTFTVPDLVALAPREERVYRMRCVEAWSMVIPWAGFSLSKLLEAVQPLPDAKYVAFETLLDSSRMPGQKSRVLSWPYTEGLRLDEAMHPLTLLATGMYGRELPPQDGAPVRLVVPWKYGFKGIKSIVKISLTAEEPPSTWNLAAPREYGFYANVNPAVDHPRWSQATEQRIGESGRRRTLPFNGYAEQVAHLYSGMDLRADF